MPYHISPKTGKAAVCRATKACPLGDTPHFASKAEAENHMQAELQAKYSAFPTTTKAAEALISQVTERAEDEDIRNSSSSTDFMTAVMPEGSTIVDIIEEPDYVDTLLVQYEGQHYAARVHTYTWGDQSSLSSFRRVEPVTAQQEKATLKEVEEIADAQDLINELEASEELRHLVWTDDETGEVNIQAAQAQATRLVREDGSTLIVHPIKAAGDRNLSDEPAPIDVPLTFEENGQRQNSREMDEGLLIYDTRLGQGLVMKWRGGSEIGVSDSRYVWDGKKLKAQPYESKWYALAPGDLYFIKGTGEMQDVTYYKYV